MTDVNGELLYMKQATKLLCVSRQTVRNWYLNGRIKLVVLPSGRFRVPRSEVDRILATEEVNYESANADRACDEQNQF